MSPLTQRSKTQYGTYLVVTVITLLIWIWAAGETRNEDTVYARVKVVTSSDFETIVFPIDDQQVAIEVKGSARSIQRLRQVLSQPLALITGSNGIPREAGDHVISLVESIQNQPVIQQGDITILTTEPSTLKVEIDSMTQISVPVEPVLTGVTLGGEAVSNPETVTLTLPSRIVAQIPSARVIAEPSPSTLSGLEAGRSQRILVPVRLPSALRPYAQSITIEPTSVQLAFTLILRTRSSTLSTVPVQVAAPAQDLGEYEVVIDPSSQFLADVVVEGAVDLVKKFEENKSPVVAFVHLTSDDLSRMVKEAPVTLWELPEGLRVTSVGGDTAQPFIKLLIRRRDK
ncbi:MAG: hypothetical protein CBC35_11465 [Planctomycetes bacterium TMED75]|nr:hypothetical protein [Planctomycetaceae bacterium]OUU90652.1 MAG: hypothetical protein CBC35_11465 [Planctomycetes bacterium TMED75]